MKIISPSILACDFMNIEKEVKSFENEKDLWLHLDVMDGHFVPNLTFGTPIIKQISKITSIPLDVHLMVTNPEFIVDTLSETNVLNITYHFEASTNHLNLISKIKSQNKMAGISIRPKTNVEDLSNEILEHIDLILVMSVEPGFGGQSFIESTYSKIEKLNKLRQEKNFNYQIQVDGGVNNLNAKKLFDAGADNLVAGSYIFKKNNYHEAIDSLRL